MKLDFYILDAHKKAVRIIDLLEWGHWMLISPRVVSQERIDRYFISTIFVGVNYCGSKTPMLYETLVSTGEDDIRSEPSATWEEAERQHSRVAADIRLGATC